MGWWMAIPAVVGAVSGIAKNQAMQRQANASRKIRAAEIRASPWTGVAPSTQVQHAGSMFGDILQGAGTGAAMGQSIKGAMGKAALQDAQTNAWNRMGSQQPGGTGMNFSGSYQMPSFSSYIK
jgi:hypothetical protein